jgi:hypothetical protein
MRELTRVGTRMSRLPSSYRGSLVRGYGASKIPQRLIRLHGDRVYRPLNVDCRLIGRISAAAEKRYDQPGWPSAALV